MDKAQLIALFDRDQRKEIEFYGLRREATPAVVRHIDKTEGGEGMITFTQMNAGNADRTIQEQVRYFGSIGQDFEWKLYNYDQPADLKKRLTEHGFVVEASEAVMVLDLNEASEVIWQPVTHKILKIRDPEKLSDVLKIQQQVWDEDFSSLGEYLGGIMRDIPDRMSVYVAYVDEQPVSAAWIYFQEKSQFASLWGGATLKEFRQQGIYTALLAVRAQEARKRRVRYLVVDASDMSAPILEKFGFEVIATSFPCKWRRPIKE